MTTTRAAKYLAPIDLGKTIAVTDANTGKTVTGELQSIDAIGYNIELGIIAGKDSGEYRVNYDAEVALTGQPSPDGWDQPAQALPAPIPAAQAADDAELGISTGPVCCTGDCCGPGSYCCTHPENNHAHPLDDDEPDHEHIATLQNPEHCTRCDAVLEYDENGNRK